MGAVVAKHEAGHSGMEQQVGGFEGKGEALDVTAEVKGVPQVVVGGIHKQVLKNTRGTRTTQIFKNML